MLTPLNHLTKFRLDGARMSLLAACVLLAALSLSQSLLPAGSAEARRAPAPSDSARLAENYGKLPLRFEANRGQTDRAVKFLARGSGYTLFLAETGAAVLRLRAANAEGEEKRTGTLRLTLEGANRKPSVSGLDELPGRSNYLVGRDARAWRTNVPAFGRVRYEAVYEGIDAVYYGRQGRLEYDFVVARGADPSRIGLRFDGARQVRVDERGDLVISTGCGDVRQQRPFAYQETDGGRREVSARYVLDRGGRVRFELGEYDRGRTLVIDPVLLYSSYLGGTGNDEGLAVAVDAAGSAYVAGMTTSTDYPNPSSLQAENGGFRDAFVLKLAPDGRSLVYATYLGGNGDDFATSIGVDTAGNAYVGGFSSSSNFATTVGSFQPFNAGIGDAFLAKLNPTGTGFVYSTYIGGKGTEQASSVAVDAAGAAYVAGRTDSINFTNAPAVNRAGSAVYKSTDGGASWGPSASGLTSTVVNDFAVAPGAPNVVYAGATLGVYKSTDGGASWQFLVQTNSANVPFNVRSVVVDPANASVVYAASGGGFGIYKSTDGGVTFEGKGSGLLVPIVNTLVINPSNSSVVYAGTRFGVFKTTNGGDSWVDANGPIFGTAPQINKLVIDSSNPQVLYAATVNRGVLKTTDGGANWVQVNNGLAGQFGTILQPRTLALDPSNPSTIYGSFAGSFSTSGSGIYKSIDGGASWTSSSNGLTITLNGQTVSPPVNAILIDPVATSNVYAATNGYGIYKSTDGGANWAPVNTGLANRTVLALAARPGSPAALLAGAVAGGDPFVLKLNPAGSAAEYVRMLGGSENDDARTVVLGPGGSAYVVGTTASLDFPTVNARQAALDGLQDAFVVKLASNGSSVYSTYLGGNSYDIGAGLAVGSDGSAYVVGMTASTDFPTVNPLKSTLSGQNDFQDGFVTKLSPDGQTLVYSTYLGGASIDQATGVAVGADGSAHVVGSTASQDFPLAGAANALNGFQDAFVSKLNPAGTALVYSTCFGGNDFEQANAVALDGAGGIYVTGATSSTNLPLMNTAQATFGGGSEDAFVAKFGPGIDLALTLSDSPDPVAFGADLTYTLKVKNNGDLPATGVQLADALPAGATLVSAASDRGSCTGTTNVVCAVGTLGGGEEANVTVKVKPPATRAINNTATVTLNETDANPANNSASVETTVNFADLAVTKSVLVGTVAPGAKVVFLLTVTNRSGADAPSVTLSDALPAGLTFSACDAPGGICGGSGSTRTVTYTSLAVGETASATIAATLDPNVAVGSVLNNTATVASAFPDSDPSNNSATAAVTAAPFAAGARANGKVVLAAGDGIYTVNADGTGRTKIHSTPANTAVYDPVWSPDGTQIVFRRYVPGASFPATPYNFYVMGADGSNPRRVAGSLTESRATWSPDGSHVAYVKYNGATNAYDLYAARVDGAGEARIASVPGIATNFDWSPDGSRFVFEKNHQQVFVMNADGSNQRQLTFTEQTADGLTRDEDPHWSFDGARVTFSRSNNVTANIYVINADGTGLRRLLNEYTVGGQLSPDGTKFVTDGVYVKNVDESVYPYWLGEGRDPSWQSLSDPNPTPTPAPPEAFSISGHVTSNGGGYYPIRLSGTRAVTITTDSAGNYTFFNLPKGTYTVTPQGPSGSTWYVYTPGSRTVSDLKSDVTGFDFTVSRAPRAVSGRVIDSAGNPLAGLRVTDTPGNQFFGATTDAQGRYSINLGDGPFQLTFQIFSSTYSFDPVRAVVRQPPGDLTINFVGAPFAGVGSLGGRIIDTSGFGIGGLPVTLGGARNAVVRTNDDGTYVFYNLPAGQNYTVKPSTADGLAFTPAQRSYQNLGASPAGLDPFIANAALPTAQFAVTNVTVAENARVVELTVTRGPDPQLAAYLDFETSDLTASERSDYIAATGTVRFAPGETSQKVRVLLTDDGLYEGERAFKVTLTGGRNLFVGSAREAVVRITDDDASNATSNPLNASDFFVRQHYADFLNREPDAPGLAFWIQEIEQCGQDAQCREVKRVNVSAAFFLSIEFQQTGFLVYRLHQSAFGTGERLNPKVFTKDTREIGRDIVVGAAGWEEHLEANKRAFIEEFVTRPEFRLAYPLTMPNAVFVDTLNANAGGSLTQAERDALVAGLTSGATTRAQALRAVAENAEFTRRETNRAFVLMQYFGYLRRAPSAPPDADFAGFNFWLSKLNEFGGNYINAEMVKAFLDSLEYKKRFGPQ